MTINQHGHSQTMIRTVILPVPPSVNALYANRKFGRGVGRYKTREYRDWLTQADICFSAQKLGREPTMTGPLEVEIRLPKIRGDVSNRIKAAEDYLVSRLITGDDKNNRKVTAEIDESLGEFCHITITPL